MGCCKNQLKVMWSPFKFLIVITLTYESLKSLPLPPWLVEPLGFPPAFKKNEGVKITSEKGAKGQMNVKNQVELSQKLAQDRHIVTKVTLM